MNFTIFLKKVITQGVTAGYLQTLIKFHLPKVKFPL